MPKGIYIFKVLEDTGAENSAIQERDIITKLDGQGVYTTADLKSLLSKYRAGEEVKLTLMRQDGSGKYNEMEVKVVLGKASALSGNNGNSGNAPSQNGGQGNQNTPEETEPSTENGNGSTGEENPFKSFQDFFNEYKR